MSYLAVRCLASPRHRINIYLIGCFTHAALHLAPCLAHLSRETFINFHLANHTYQHLRRTIHNLSLNLVRRDPVTYLHGQPTKTRTMRTVQSLQNSQPAQRNKRGIIRSSPIQRQARISPSARMPQGNRPDLGTLTTAMKTKQRNGGR